MDFSGGILLGLSTGLVCLAYCGPVLIPYLLGENKNIGRNAFYVALFLLGRLAGYIVIGLIAGIAGKMFIQPFNLKILIGVSSIALSILLIAYGFYQFKEVCLGQLQHKVASKYAVKMPYIAPIIGGLMTGLNICPPFILAITRAAATNNIVDSMLFFIMFFIGTSLFFIPLPFLGIFKRMQVLRIVGKFSAILAGVLYLYNGLLMTFS